MSARSRRGCTATTDPTRVGAFRRIARAHIHAVVGTGEARDVRGGQHAQVAARAVQRHHHPRPAPGRSSTERQLRLGRVRCYHDGRRANGRERVIWRQWHGYCVCRSRAGAAFLRRRARRLARPGPNPTSRRTTRRDRHEKARDRDPRRGPQKTDTSRRRRRRHRSRRHRALVRHGERTRGTPATARGSRRHPRARETETRPGGRMPRGARHRKHEDVLKSRASQGDSTAGPHSAPRVPTDSFAFTTPCAAVAQTSSRRAPPRARAAPRRARAIAPVRASAGESGVSRPIRAGGLRRRARGSGPPAARARWTSVRSRPTSRCPPPAAAPSRWRTW